MQEDDKTRAAMARKKELEDAEAARDGALHSHENVRSKEGQKSQTRHAAYRWISSLRAVLAGLDHAYTVMPHT